MDEKTVIYPKGGGWYVTEDGAQIQLSKVQIDAGNYEVRKPPLEQLMDEPEPIVDEPEPEPLATVTPISRTEGVSEWGPYAEYAIIHTPYGDYAVEPGYRMTFEPYLFFDPKAMTERTSFRPVYTWAIEDRNYGKSRDELVRGNVAPAPARI